MIRLGVNIDHVATVRNARGEIYPDPVYAAAAADLGGAENITFHLREDRRHIRDRDVLALKDAVNIPLNFEMAATPEMLRFAMKVRPHSVTLVPEKREERTTEGGLDVIGQKKILGPIIQELSNHGIMVSLFIEPDSKTAEATASLGAQAVEFHTGKFCELFKKSTLTREKLFLLNPLIKAAKAAKKVDLQVHVGHGLNYVNAHWMQLVPHLEEANIGHAIVARSIFVGMTTAVREMKALLNDPNLKPYVP